MEKQKKPLINKKTKLQNRLYMSRKVRSDSEMQSRFDSGKNIMKITSKANVKGYSSKR